MFTPRKNTSPPTPAYSTLRDGPPYRPNRPWTALPLPSTQKRQPSGGAGHDGSGRQAFGGTQLRLGGDGQVGGTTNRFKGTPPAAPMKAQGRLVDPVRSAGLLGIHRPASMPTTQPLGRLLATSNDLRVALALRSIHE